MSDAFELPNSRPAANPQLKDVLDQFKKEIFLSMNCHHIGTVQSFNANTIAGSPGIPAKIGQTATATINYKKTFYQLDAVTGAYAPVLVDYPLLVDCPVICLGGGAGALTFPIKQGDECLVLFNDRDLDNWFAGGGGAGVATPRLHSFSDGLIIVGLRSSGNVIQNYDTTRVVLRNDAASVGVGPSLIKISNATYSLLTVINGLIDVVKGIQTIPAVMGAPLTLDPSVIASLQSYKTTVGSLLE